MTSNTIESIKSYALSIGLVAGKFSDKTTGEFTRICITTSQYFKNAQPIRTNSGERRFILITIKEGHNGYFLHNHKENKYYDRLTEFMLCDIPMIYQKAEEEAARESKNVEKIEKIVRVETKQTLEQYIKFSEKYAADQFDRWIKVSKEDLVAKHFIPDVTTRNQRREIEKAFKSENDTRLKFTKGGKEACIERARLNAISSYDAATKKLSVRISQKGLNVPNLKVKSAQMNGNLESIFTDGEKTLRSFTILAWGEVNAPHYRYLIK